MAEVMDVFPNYATSVALTIAALIAVNSVIKLIVNFVKQPSGPWGVPLLGYAPFLTAFPHKKLMQLSAKYSSVFGLRLGPSNVVVINGWPAVKEALSKEQLLDRVPFLTSFGIIPSVVDASGK